MAVLKPSTNLFALLDSNDPGDTANNDAVQASAPVNINRKQQPEPSIWKLKAIEANAAKNKKKKKQPAEEPPAPVKPMVPPPPPPNVEDLKQFPQLK
ncbi:hypothetical protein EJB05_45540 [Eragrostis curvula]|uniref:Uncharacterized protein n=1 Tax=Eragrostis curvula TaxID=38414 RepID=A0A5J9TKL9_9POAL|nr:hypothetical protein EJB05_45540 [Eragrostis curvula]